MPNPIPLFAPVTKTIFSLVIILFFLCPNRMQRYEIATRMHHVCLGFSIKIPYTWYLSLILEPPSADYRHKNLPTAIKTEGRNACLEKFNAAT
jgi:hypothetical protein